MDHNLLRVEDVMVAVEVHKLLLVLVEYNHPLVKDEEEVVET